MGFVDHLGLWKEQPQHNLGFLQVTLLTTLLDNNAARAFPHLQWVVILLKQY